MEHRETVDVIRRLETLLDDGRLDEETTDALVELLTPGPAEPWPDLEAVLHLAEHPVVADDLKRHAVPDRLEQAIGEALEAVFPLLGIRPYGPTFKLVDIARRRLDSEAHKYELIAERLESLDDEERREIVARYLGTEPAPMFVNRLRRLYPEIVSRAKRARESDQGARAALDGLVDDLDEMRADGVPVLEAVYRIVEAFDGPAEETAARGLASEEADEQLVGAALMAHFGLEGLLATAFRRVMDGSPGAPILAVLASRMAPRRAQSAFSTFLAEVSWQNPEMPEATLTPARVCAILSTRAVLPLLGSPIERLSEQEIPEHVDDPDMRNIPETVYEAWERWTALTD